VQRSRRRLEGAVVEDRQERAQLIEVHEAMLMIRSQHSLVFTTAAT
jgi:hypothetical protein